MRTVLCIELKDQRNNKTLTDAGKRFENYLKFFCAHREKNMVFLHQHTCACIALKKYSIQTDSNDFCFFNSVAMPSRNETIKYDQYKQFNRLFIWVRRVGCATVYHCVNFIVQRR